MTTAICLGDSFGDGWYLAKMKQILKDDPSDPDHIKDWVERKDGQWDLGSYKRTCTFDSVIRKEESKD